jgi:hypothetical protein
LRFREDGRATQSLFRRVCERERCAFLTSLAGVEAV